MNRPSVRRSLVAAATSAALVIGLLAATTTAALGADTRTVYFGDPADPDGAGLIAPTPVTAGGVFTFDVTARNLGNQTLAHATLGLGTGAAARTSADYAGGAAGPIPDGTPSLPPGAEILAASLDGAACAFDGAGASCAIGNFRNGDAVTATFVVRAPASAVETWIWTTFKVAENVNDQGANQNTFFADAALLIGPTTSNAVSTYLLGNQPLKAGTAGQELVPGDRQRTTVEVPGGFGGFVSLVETDNPTGCSPKCIGQEVQANVRNGAILTPYLLWTLVIDRTDVNANKGGVIHTLDNGDEVTIANTKDNACSTKLPVDCIESFVVNKRSGTTTIVFRTPTNGAVRGFG